MDPYNLQRFIDAQAATYGRATQELEAGRKQSHWMWFIFPQFKGLGTSAMAQHYAIDSLPEANAYADHPVLGPRLEHCTQLVNQIEGRSIESIFGWPDHLKFHSSMTLFARATGAAVFAQAIDRYFAATPDERTLQLTGS